MQDRIEEIIEDDNTKLYVFYCNGCGMHHSFRVGDKTKTKKPIWDFNDSLVKPTFNPTPINGVEVICHSYVKDGKIQYLNDC